MESLIATILSPQFIATMLASIAAFATVLTLVAPLLQRDRLNQRMKVMAVERDKMRSQRLAEMSAKDRAGARLRQTPKGYMQQIVDKFDLRAQFDSEEVRDRAEDGGSARAGTTRRLHVFPRRDATGRVPARAGLRLFHRRTDASADDQVPDGAGRGFPRVLSAERVRLEPFAKAPEVDQAGLPRRARHAAHLRAVGHVRGSRVRQGRQGSDGPVDRTWRGAITDDCGAFVSAGAPHGVRKPRQAHRPAGRQGGLHGA